MAVVNSLEWPLYERHFADARLRHYLAECNGDKDLAMRLYCWNAEISSAVWESLSFLEVAFRNAIDRQMTLIHANKGRSGHWIFDDARELGRDGRGPGKHRYPYEDVAIAMRRVQKNNMPLSSGQVISEISFGFWHQMVSSRQRFLWPDLVAAFPNSPNRRQDTIHDPVASLRDFRNRIGHHHRIWSLPITDKYDELLAVAGYIDVDLPAWIDQRSRVRAVLAHRP